MEDVIDGVGITIFALAVGAGVIGMLIGLWQMLFGPKRRCDVCDEAIRLRAIKCKHCGERF